MMEERLDTSGIYMKSRPVEIDELKMFNVNLRDRRISPERGKSKAFSLRMIAKKFFFLYRL